jgi:hypothetical protein
MFSGFAMRVDIPSQNQLGIIQCGFESLERAPFCADCKLKKLLFSPGNLAVFLFFSLMLGSLTVQDQLHVFYFYSVNVIFNTL